MVKYLLLQRKPHLSARNLFTSSKFIKKKLMPVSAFTLEQLRFKSKLLECFPLRIPLGKLLILYISFFHQSIMIELIEMANSYLHGFRFSSEPIIILDVCQGRR